MAKNWDPIAGLFVDDIPQPPEPNLPRTDTLVPSLGTSPLDPAEDAASGTAPTVSSTSVPELGS